MPILCGPRQLRPTATVPGSDPNDVASRPATSQPTWTPPHLGKVLKAKSTLATDTENPPSLAQCAVRQSTSKVGAVCGSSARTDLCGGRLETAVPTAIVIVVAFGQTSVFEKDSTTSVTSVQRMKNLVCLIGAFWSWHPDRLAQPKSAINDS